MGYRKISAVLLCFLSLLLAVPFGTSVKAEICYPEEIDMSGEPYTVAIQVVTLPGIRNKNKELLEAAINEITVPAINCKVELQEIWISDIVNTTNMAVAGNEKIDLVHVGTVQPLSSLTSSDILLDMNEGDLLQNHGGTLLELFSDKLDCGKVKDRQLAVPARTFNAAARGFVYNDQIAREAHLELSGTTTLDEMEEAFYAVHEQFPDIYPFYHGTGEINLLNWIEDYTVLGNEASCGIACHQDGEYRVVNLYETEMFRDYCLRMYRWRRDGIQPGDPGDNTSTQEYFSQGKLFAMVSQIDANTMYYLVNQDGRSMECTLLSEPEITNSNLTEYMWGIASNSRRPDKAMDFLNYAYTDERVANLLMYGIPEENYSYAGPSRKVIQSNGSYNVTFMQIGNRENMLIRTPADESFPVRAGELEAEAVVSPLCNYVFDFSDFQMEENMIYSTIMEYLPLLQCGICGSEEETLELLEEFNRMLEAAGIREVIEANQKQLDDYMNRRE